MTEWPESVPGPGARLTGLVAGGFGVWAGVLVGNVTALGVWWLLIGPALAALVVGLLDASFRWLIAGGWIAMLVILAVEISSLEPGVLFAAAGVVFGLLYLVVLPVPLTAGFVVGRVLRDRVRPVSSS